MGSKKKSTETQPPRQRPGLHIAWVSFSITLLLACAICIVGSGLKKYYAQNILRQSLESSRGPQAQKALQAMVQTPAVTRLLLTLIGSAPPKLLPGQREQYQRVFNILMELRGRTPENAVKEIKLLDPALVARVATTLDREQAAKRLEQIKGEIGSYTEAFSAMKRDQNVISSDGMTLMKLRTEFRLLAQDFGELMTLRPELEEDDASFVAVYNEGILKDLPKLARLPDGIQDLKELKEKLDKVNGQVQVQGANPHEQFKLRIETLRETSLTLQAQLDVMIDQEKGDSNVGNNAGERGALRTARLRAEGAIISLLLDLTPTQTDPVTKAFIKIAGI